MTNARTATILLILSACLLTAGAAMGDPEWSGYVQARLNFYDGDLNKADEFDLRRVRLKSKWPVNDDGTVVTVQFGLSALDDPGGGSVALKDAKIEHRFSRQWHARLGYASIPFGFEVPYSSSKRLPLERSHAAKEFFPGERDNGLYFIYRPDRTDRPRLTVGYSNGPHKWRNTDQQTHALVLAARWPLPNAGCAGVSYMDATRVRQDPNTQQNVRIDNSVWNAYVRCNGKGDSGSLAFQGETYWGKLLGVEASGWYVMGEVAPRNVPATFFYRYDRFGDKGPEPTYRRHTAGAAAETADNVRITVQWENYRGTDGRAYTNYAFQWQVKH